MNIKELLSKTTARVFGSKFPENGVQLIHKEVEALVAEAPLHLEQQINRPSDVAYAKRLSDVGLTNSSMYLKHRKQLQANVGAERRLEVLKVLQSSYPFRKFVLKEDLKALMEKWDMHSAPLNAYKGTIPEKNLIDLEKYESLPTIFLPYVDYDKRNIIRIIAFANELKLDGLVKASTRYYDFPQDPIIYAELDDRICEIITKWASFDGDQSINDPLLVNPINN